MKKRLTVRIDLSCTVTEANMAMRKKEWQANEKWHFLK